MADQYSEFLDSMALKQRSQGKSTYQSQEQDLVEWWGFLPSFRLGHLMGLHGIGASLVDIATDPLNFAPDFVAKGIGKMLSIAQRGREGVQIVEDVAKANKVVDDIVDTAKIAQPQFGDAVNRVKAAGKEAARIRRADYNYGKWRSPQAKKAYEEAAAQGVKAKQEIQQTYQGAPPAGEQAIAAETTPGTRASGKMVATERQLAQYRAESQAKAPYNPLSRALGRREPSPAFEGFKESGAPAIDVDQRVLDTIDNSVDTVLGRGSLEGSAAGDFRENWIAKTQWVSAYKGQLKRDLMEAAARIPKVEGLEYQQGELVGDMLLDREKYFLPNNDGNFPITQANLKPEFSHVPSQALRLAESLDNAVSRIGVGLAERKAIHHPLQDYWTRIVEFPKGAEGDVEATIGKAAGVVSGNMKNFSRFQLARTIGDFSELKALEAEKGWRVRRDVAHVFPEYVGSFGKKLADQDAVELIGRSKLVVDGVDKTFPLVTRDISKFPPKVQKLYELSRNDSINTIAHQEDLLKGGALRARQYALMDAVRNGKYSAEEAGEKGMQLLSQAMNQQRSGKVWVAKEIHGDLRNLFDYGLGRTPVSGDNVFKKLARVAMRVNATAKRWATSLSGFHIIAIARNGAALHGADIIDLSKGLSFAGDEFARNADMVEWFVRHGVTFNGMGDVERGAVGEAMAKSTEWLRSKGLPVPESAPEVLAKMARGVSWPQKQIDFGLWDYLHPRIKYWTAHELLYDALRNPKWAHLSESEITRQVASTVNQAFGGLNWQRLMVSRGGLDGMRLMAFAPDWHISNFKMAADVYTGIKKIGPGQKIPFGHLMAGEVSAYYARQYALRLRLINATIANMANFAFSAARHGQGRWIDENPQGFRNKILMPWGDSAGRDQYYDWGSLFQEPYDMINAWSREGGPGRFLRRKASPVLGMAITTVSGYDFLGVPIVSTKDGPVDVMIKRAGVFAEPFEPFSVRMLRQSLFPGETPVKHERKKSNVISGLASFLGVTTRPGPR